MKHPDGKDMSWYCWYAVAYNEEAYHLLCQSDSCKCQHHKEGGAGDREPRVPLPEKPLEAELMASAEADN